LSRRNYNAVTVESIIIFFLGLKSGNSALINKIINSFQSETKALIKKNIQLVYFMRGAIQYNEMMNLTYVEREMIEDFIGDRLEQEKKSPHPVY